MFSSPVSIVPPAAAPSSPVSTGLEIKWGILVVPDGYVFPPICPTTGDVTRLGIPVTRRLYRNQKREMNAGDLIAMAAIGGDGAFGTDQVINGSFTFRPSQRALRRWRLYRILGYLMMIGSIYGFAKGSRSELVWTMLFFLGALGAAVALGALSGPRPLLARNGKVLIGGIPQAVRKKIIAIEERRIEAAERARLTQGLSENGTVLHPSPHASGRSACA